MSIFTRGLGLYTKEGFAILLLSLMLGLAFSDSPRVEALSAKQPVNHAQANTVDPVAVKAIATRDIYSLLLKNDGTVWAWFSLFLPTAPLVPTQIAGLSEVVAIAAGDSHNLVLKQDGTVWAWGSNGAGQLGIDSGYYSRVPVQATGLSEVVAIAAGNLHSLALKRDGTVWAWGNNSAGQLGIGANDTDIHPLPMKVIGLSGVVAIAAGDWYSLALKGDGTVWAWGDNQIGELGTRSTADCSGSKLITSPCSPVPLQVRGLSGVVAIAAGGHSLALKGDGTVWAWGPNDKGQLGTALTTACDGFSCSRVPVQVSGLGGVIAIGAGEYHSLALKRDGTVWAWGMEFDLGIGISKGAPHPQPVNVTNLSGIIAIAAGRNMSLALKRDGTVWAWGAGPLGDGSVSPSLVPVRVKVP